MATVTAIRERTQNRVAMNKVIAYVCQDKKTLFQQDGRQVKLISGMDCCPETAYSEFMATMRQYGKASGVFFYQYVQSFKPSENATPEQIHQIGLELTQQFEGHEVLVATHIDADHWHNHLIVNSVSHATGKKLQFNMHDLNAMRRKSDEICMAHGLSVLPAYQQQKKKALGQREYRAALRGNSWKFALMAAIDKAMAQSRSQAEFTACMERQSYQVKWEPQHKYITYTTPEGQRCRDIRLHDNKYLKTNMEEHYAQFRRTQKPQYAVGDADRDHPLSPAGQRYSDRAMEHHAPQSASNSQPPTGVGAICSRSADRQVGREHDGGLLFGSLPEAARPSGTDRQNGAYGNEIGFVGTDGIYDEYDDKQAANASDWDGEYAPAPGYVGAETQAKVDGHRGVDLDSVLHIANTVEDLVNPFDPEQEKKKIKPQPERKRQKRQRRNHEQDYDLSL